MAALVLQYAGRDLNTARRIPPAIFPILLTFAHINLCWQLSQTMISRICWAERLDFSVWAPAAWIPGSVIAGHAGILGLLAMLLPSILAGGLLWNVITRYCGGIRPVFGAASWRFGALVLLWACWLPIPAPYSVACLFSNWANNAPS
jgi:hypothetical protein